MKGGMKYVVIRCEDEAPRHLQASSLLAGAKAAHLESLAQSGAAGLLQTRVLDRFGLHRALCGLPAREPSEAGRCYAAEANVSIGPEETAWCCELVTQRDGRIVDPTAGQIPTKESSLLIQGLDEQLGSEARRWYVGRGSHHILVTTDPALSHEEQQGVPAPDALVGEAWDRALPKGAGGDALRLLLDETAKVLEAHPVNRVRIDLGENPANFIWLWGASRGKPPSVFSERTGLSGTVVSGSFPMKGFARAFGLDWHEAPGSLEEASMQRLVKQLFDILDRRDFVYLHLKVTASDPVERLCAMERIDQLLLKPLTERLPAHGAWRLLAAVDDRTARAVPFVAAGSSVAQQPAASLQTKDLAESSLAFDDSSKLFAWFMAP